MEVSVLENNFNITSPDYIFISIDASFIHHGQVLHIQSLNRHSSGNYECSATNGIGSPVKKSISISFKGIFSSNFSSFPQV